MNKILFSTYSAGLEIDTEDWLIGIRYSRHLDCCAGKKGLLSIGILCLVLHIVI